MAVFHVDIRHGLSFAFVVLDPTQTSPSVTLPPEVQQVVAFLDDDDCQVAWPYAELSVSRHPLDASAYDARGRVEACYSLRKDATKDFVHALQLRPRYLRAYYDLRTLARDFGDDDAAARVDELMTTIEPDDLAGYIAEGEAFSHLDDDATAYASFDVVRGSGTQTEQADAAYETAELEDRRDDNAAAIIELNRAIAIEPNFTKAFCERSRVEELELFELDPYDVAIPLQPLYQQELRDTAEALKRKVTLPCVLDHQSLADLIMHDNAAAAAHARGVIAARPTDNRGYADLALAAAASGDRKLMDDSLRRSAALGGNTGYPLIKRAEAHFAIADVPATEADIAALERSHYNPEYTQMLAGALLIAVDRFDAASKTLESAASENPLAQNHLLLLLAQAGLAARRAPHSNPGPLPSHPFDWLEKPALRKVIVDYLSGVRPAADVQTALAQAPPHEDAFGRCFALFALGTVARAHGQQSAAVAGLQGALAPGCAGSVAYDAAQVSLQRLETHARF